MGENDLILKVDNLGKCFKIYQNPWDRAKEWLSFSEACYHKPFWSFRNISFEVRRGQFLGIIGENGAGKSTLLKIITGILKPTEGTYQLNGKVLSLLELGTDFNFALTGRENALYRSELLGFPRGYMRSKLAEIEDFSELGEFFDRPVKLYSSGMKARLAFSLFAFLECDVLILDEVLAVGDIFFQQKCYARLEKLIAKKVTIILVTHGLATVQQYCDEVILLHRGQKLFQGEPKKGILEYHQLRRGGSREQTADSRQQVIGKQKVGNAEDFFWPTDENLLAYEASEVNFAELVRYGICDQKGKLATTFQPGELAWLCSEFLVKETIEVPLLGVNITNKFNVVIHAKSSHQHQANVPQRVEAGSIIRFCRQITLNISPGQYVVSFSLGMVDVHTYNCINELPQAEFNNQIKIGDVYQQVGTFWIKPHYNINRQSHWGICNLPGDCQVQVVAISAETKG
ncbi:MAG: ABC transporter ATP-binding protein [Spirulinaceae cyanobacterium]